MSAVRVEPSLPLRIRVSTFVRSFAIQGSWNYRTMLGQGFAFALLPVLRHVHGGKEGALERAVERHAHHFNAHPYLADLALGAVARMEADGADPADIERFKDAVRGPLGSLGDRLVWAGGLPVAALLALVIMTLGGPVWLPPLVFLVAYNTGHLTLRIWAFRMGLDEGAAVVRRLSAAHLSQVAERLMRMGMFLVGALAGVLAVRMALAQEAWMQLLPLVALGLVFVGERLGTTAWRIATLATVFGVVGLFTLGVLT